MCVALGRFLASGVGIKAKKIVVGAGVVTRIMVTLATVPELTRRQKSNLASEYNAAYRKATGMFLQHVPDAVWLRKAAFRRFLFTCSEIAVGRFLDSLSLPDYLRFYVAV